MLNIIAKKSIKSFIENENAAAVMTMVTILMVMMGSVYLYNDKIKKTNTQIITDVVKDFSTGNLFAKNLVENTKKIIIQKNYSKTLANDNCKDIGKEIDRYFLNFNDQREEINIIYKYTEKSIDKDIKCLISIERELNDQETKEIIKNYQISEFTLNISTINLQLDLKQRKLRIVASGEASSFEKNKKMYKNSFEKKSEIIIEAIKASDFSLVFFGNKPNIEIGDNNSADIYGEVYVKKNKNDNEGFNIEKFIVSKEDTTKFHDKLYSNHESIKPFADSDLNISSFKGGIALKPIGAKKNILENFLDGLHQIKYNDIISSNDSFFKYSDNSTNSIIIYNSCNNDNDNNNTIYKPNEIVTLDYKGCEEINDDDCQICAFIVAYTVKIKSDNDADLKFMGSIHTNKLIFTAGSEASISFYNVRDASSGMANAGNFQAQFNKAKNFGFNKYIEERYDFIRSNTCKRDNDGKIECTSAEESKLAGESNTNFEMFIW